ncbi:hypothetical protein SEA_DUMPTRUCK_99 [Gordonia phage DumpTruck]|nr:hypothetical protein SEA_DUMPTRUCK_99 [Gordonia phage DumpTruck]
METLAEPKNGHVIRSGIKKATCSHCSEPIYEQLNSIIRLGEGGTTWVHSRTFMVSCRRFDAPRSVQVESTEDEGGHHGHDSTEEHSDRQPQVRSDQAGDRSR